MRTILEIVKGDVELAEREGDSSYLSDLEAHGCVSGMVSSLIYYHDTSKFFSTHRTEILGLLSGVLEASGLGVHELFESWDASDPLASASNNKNILAWFAYEETARILNQEES